ncbi:hypothetical protein EBT25_17520, partial [bacterium]|nr:hypothetical protein [bacterium]
MASFAKAVGQQVKKNVKQAAVKGVSNALFGKGMVGRALAKTFESKFQDEEGSDDRVPAALDKQAQMQGNVSATLARIETITMNIADNVYNLAGVMNAQVVSMKEAQRLQQERMYKEAAAAEEAGAEAKGGPTPAATSTGGAAGNKKNIISFYDKIIGRIGGIKKMFGAFTKRFGLVALGVISAATAVAAFASSGSEPTGGEASSTAASGGATLESGAGGADVVPSSGGGGSAPTSSGGGGAAPTAAATPSASAAPTAAEPTQKPDQGASDMMGMFSGMIQKHGSAKDKENAPMIGNIMNAGSSGDMGGFMQGIQEYAAKNPQPATQASAPSISGTDPTMPSMP